MRNAGAVYFFPSPPSAFASLRVLRAFVVQKNSTALILTPSHVEKIDRSTKLKRSCYLALDSRDSSVPVSLR